MTSTTSTDAIQWVKDNKKIIIQKFADLSIYLPVQNPTTTEQKEIVEKLEAVQNYKKLLLKQKSFLKELFDSVLDKSMKGGMDR